MYSSQVTADNEAYTQGVSLFIYFVLFTFGPGCCLKQCAHIGCSRPAGGGIDKWLIRTTTALKIVHLALRTKRLDTPGVE